MCFTTRKCHHRVYILATKPSQGVYKLLFLLIYSRIQLVDTQCPVKMAHSGFQIMALVIATVLSSTLATSNESQVYYVCPDDIYHCQVICPNRYCYPLSYYLRNITHYFASDTKIIFLPGNHSVDIAVPIENVANLTLRLIGSGDFNTSLHNVTSESASRIKCNGSVAGFSFENVSDLVIQDLMFIGCGGVNTSCYYYTALSFYSIINLTMSGVTVQDSRGVGVCGDKILGNSTIIDSTFTFTNGTPGYGGNMQLYYKNCPDMFSDLYIGFSQFLHGNDWVEESYATGLSLSLDCTNVRITIDNVTMTGNRASRGGNLAISVHDTLGISTIPVQVKNCNIEGGIADVGGGVHISVVEMPSYDTFQCNNETIVHVYNTNFVNNFATITGGGLFLAHTEIENVVCSSQITIENCTFHNNSKGLTSEIGGVAMHVVYYRIQGYLSRGVPQMELFFKHCTFTQNIDELGYATSAVVYVSTEPSIYIVDSMFQDNNCTAITAVNSNIIFGGTITIAGNIGNNGGGLVLCDGSFMYLQPNTTVLFSGNHAKHTGGAIYADDNCLKSLPACFFQLDTRIFSEPELLSSVHIQFENNTAELAGSTVYGGSITYCFFLSTAPKNVNLTSSFVFNSIFHPNNSPSDMSFITSDPVGVCFCEDNWHICNSKTFTVTVYPGQIFNISAVVVGQRNGSVPGDVIATFQNSAKGTTLIHSEYLQTINSTNCSQLNYTVFSGQSRETIVLRAQQPAGFNEYYRPPNVIIELQHCPIGFTLINSPYYHCGCVHILAEHGVRCDINKSSIDRHAPAWIGCDFTKHNSSEILFHCQCPFDYCKPHDIVISTTNTSFNQDEQCAFNRKGILCGECKENLSLVLGSSQCLPCSNVYLLMLLAFAVAGVALVVLIAVCNITVTEGTINGLIFYTNIIQINRATFFPPLPHNSFIRFIASVLTVFISWINLDLGIQTCFYNSMDTYTKTWLQFAFPIYIWVIAGVIIILSRKFAIFARLVGRNGVQLLATLFLISYAKLQRTTLAVLSFAFIEHSNSSRSTVWLYDGNVPYLQGKHIPLFVVAALFGLIALLCTFILLFIQCLQKMPNVKLLFWVNRLRPLFDAYTGPYKDKYRFWTGFLIFIRDCLFVVHAVNVFGDPEINVTVTAGACFLLLIIIYGGIYKKWPLDILESSFFLNLGILCILTSYINNHGGNQAAVTYTSVGTAFVTFLGILFYHTYTKTTSSYLWRRFSIWLSRKRNPQAVLEPVFADGDSSAGENEPLLVQTRLLQWPRVIRFDQYREPLLASENNQ